jgi:signal transduction histidine kinase
VSVKRIMVVEDEGIVALDIQSKLEAKGYEVSAVVATGEDAVDSAGELLPDLVLMDIQLAGEMDGTQAAEQIHELYDIPVVYLTAFSDDRTLNRAKNAEPFGYILKPFEEKKLHATIEVALYKHQIDKEKEQLKAQLSQARKMEAIGRLTAGMAFHFTNMLQGIQGNIDLALLQASDELRPFLDAADYDSQRIAQMLRQLLVFYQGENVEHQAVDLGAVINDVASMCRDVFARNQRRSLDISVELADDLPNVRGDAGQFRQCISNLCTNARDAIEALPADHQHTSRISISAKVIDIVQGTRQLSGQATPGQYVQLSVEDNGIGMDADTQEHLFEPFYSSSNHDRGKGLGLATVYSIIREHQGWLECSSAPDEGTTIFAYLPILSEAEANAPTAIEKPEIITSEDTLFDTDTLRGSEKVLIIADIDRSRKVISEMLEYHGYEALVGLDVRDGLNLFELAHQDVALVIIDLSQPDNSSREILAQLLAIQAEARVLITTGYTQDSTPWAGARAVLNKPFKTHHLLRTVRKIIAD